MTIKSSDEMVPGQMWQCAGAGFALVLAAPLNRDGSGSVTLLDQDGRVRRCPLDYLQDWYHMVAPAD